MSELTTDGEDEPVDTADTSELELMPTGELEQLLDPTPNEPQVDGGDLEVDDNGEDDADFDPYNRV